MNSAEVWIMRSRGFFHRFRHFYETEELSGNEKGVEVIS
jgi:hypothetical protein